MNWSLAESMQAPSLAAGGGSCYDIAQIAFTGQALKAVKKRVHDYVATMRLAGKSVSVIRLGSSDYRKLVAAVAKHHGVKADEISGLRHDGAPVVGC